MADLVDILCEALCAAFFLALGWLLWFGFIESAPINVRRTTRARESR